MVKRLIEVFFNWLMDDFTNWHAEYQIIALVVIFGVVWKMCELMWKLLPA